MPDRTDIWFWQRILTPHMGALAAALAEEGSSVTFVANARMSVERAAQGWEAPVLGNARLELASSPQEIQALVRAAPAGSVHLCQGLRGNGLVGHAQSLIRQRGMRQWVIMETVDDSGWSGLLKRSLYRGLFWRWGSSLEGMLGIGRDTPDWIVARGMTRSKVYPFAYFLRDPEDFSMLNSSNMFDASRAFRFIYVGRLIPLKRVDSLIEALAALDRTDIELWVVGTGPLDESLRAKSAKLLPGRVSWHGLQPMSAVAVLIAEADCLVLPSRYDGWGAVVSEALMVGTPVICSDACGAAEAVTASNVGGVYPREDSEALRQLMANMVDKGHWSPDQRCALAKWARVLGARAGAQYLLSLLQYRQGISNRPLPPWRHKHVSETGQVISSAR